MCSSWPATRPCRKASRSCARSTGTSATRRRMQLARELQPQFAALPGVTAFPITPPSLGPGLSRALDQLRDRHQRQLRQPVAGRRSSSSPRWRKNPGFVQPDTDLRLNKPEIFIEVDRDRAADAGVNVDQVARTVETMLGGRQVTRYKREADQYDVIVQTDGARPHDAGRHRQAVRARAQRRDGAAVIARQGARGGEPARAQPLQPAPLGGDHREPGAGLLARRSAAVHGRHRAQACCSPATRPS